MSGAVEAPGNLFCRAPPLFWLYKYNQSFWQALSCGQYSLINFLFFLSLLFCPVICKTKGTRPSALWMESASLLWDSFTPKSIINRLPSGRRISGFAIFLPPPENRRKKLAAENAAEFEKFSWLPQKLKLAGCDYHFY